MFTTLQVKDRLKMHKDREEERLSGAANRPSAEEEFESRVQESEVSRKDFRMAERQPIPGQFSSWCVSTVYDV